MEDQAFPDPQLAEPFTAAEYRMQPGGCQIVLLLSTSVASRVPADLLWVGLAAHATVGFLLRIINCSYGVSLQSVMVPEMQGSRSFPAWRLARLKVEFWYPIGYSSQNRTRKIE